MYLTMLFRGKRRLLLNILLLLFATAFFCMSVNLYQNSVQNLQQAADTYRTIAVMELRGSVNVKGGLLKYPNDDLRSVAVQGYDFSPILEASGVTGYDLRARYGVYVEGAVAMMESGHPANTYDVIRFRLAQDQPVTLPVEWDYDDRKSAEVRVKLEILDSAAGCYQYGDTFGLKTFRWWHDREYYEDDVKRLNRSDECESITLYPGVEYIGFNWLGYGWEKARPADTMYVDDSLNDMEFGYVDYFDEGFYVQYRDDGTESVMPEKQASEAGQPCPLMRWEDVQADPELKAKFDAVWEATKYNTGAFYATLTDDITGVPAYHLGNAYLYRGRMISEEEYASGAKVCMISLQQANLQGWRIGDKLDLHFFQFEAIPNAEEDWITEQPVYHKNTQGFFDQGEYEIVGIYSSKPLTGSSDVSQSTLAQPSNIIYLPHNAVENALPEEELPVHGALLTIWLENGSVNDFLADVEAMGLLKVDLTRYNPKFTFYDQGYSIIEPSLRAMHSTAQRLLVLSTILLVVTAVLLAYFFAQNQKANIGILRMLGGTKGRAVALLLLCAMVITAVSGGAGAVVGHTLADQVGQRILEGKLDESELAAFREFLMAAEDPDGEQVSVTSDSRLSSLSACGALLFPAVTLAFAAAYIHKEPRFLLPGSKG